jgi:hypothetical protein
MSNLSIAYMASATNSQTPCLWARRERPPRGARPPSRIRPRNDQRSALSHEPPKRLAHFPQPTARSTVYAHALCAFDLGRAPPCLSAPLEGRTPRSSSAAASLSDGSHPRAPHPARTAESHPAEDRTPASPAWMLAPARRRNSRARELPTCAGRPPLGAPDAPPFLQPRQPF